MANQLAVHSDELQAAVAFYGRQAAGEDVPKIKASLLLHYAGLDTRINQGIPAYESALEEHGVDYELHVYDGVNHAFHNDTSPTRYDEAAAKLAWERTIAFFNAITGYSQPLRYQKIAAAPIDLRDRLLELIRTETHRAAGGHPAEILAKANALVDRQLIDALYEASQAGVRIWLNIRGICCLKPDVPGLSENIEVISIVDRFLEHARVFCFHHGGDQRVFISSADWMPRNLDRRVELLVPVEDAYCRQRLVDALETCFRDNVKGRRLLANGQYERITVSVGPAVRSQQALFEEAGEAIQSVRRQRATVFEPHLPGLS